MRRAYKYSACDISELVPGTQKSIILRGALQMTKQIIAQSKSEFNVDYPVENSAHRCTLSKGK